MGTPILVLDRYYLAITFLVTLAYQLTFFLISFALKFDKLTDFAGGTNFILLACLTWGFSADRDFARNIVISLFLIVWAARLAGFLLFRILKTGKDDRFDDKRESFTKLAGFWAFQTVWVWTCSLPVTLLNSPAVTRYGQPRFGSTGLDIVGVILYACGLGIESVSDIQKYRFHAKHGRDGAVCDVGFFSWSRHPNYAGEILIQFAIYMIAAAPAAHPQIPNTSARAALYASIVSPLLLTTLLLFVSGLPLQERPGAKKRYEKGDHWPAYSRWLERTSILVPMPPGLWVRLPTWYKRTLGLEWPMYVFDPKKHSDKRQGEDGEHGGRDSDGQRLNGEAERM